tara:strand:+ start:2140 stop:2538 length:399 start_codon:yes stop_codon:yes gene_type:complete
MDKFICVDIQPNAPFLTQYTRRLLVDCIKGVKIMKPNNYIELQDIFNVTSKINTTLEPIRILFSIIPYDNSFPIINTLTPKNNNDEIQQLKIKVDKLEQIIMEHHLELEVPWGHHVYLDVGEELDDLGRSTT